MFLVRMFYEEDKIGKIIDLSGKRFERLLVININEHSAKGIFWNCICDCGNKVVVRGKNLACGRTRSCGCLRMENLVGQIFERLTVVDLCKEKTTGKTVYWNCLCVCGRKTIVRACSLKSGTSKSCGCLQKETTTKNNMLNLTNQKFGYLTAIKIVNKNRGSFVWECLCDCGNVVFVTTPELRNRDTVSCGCLTDSFIATEMKKYYVRKYDAIPEYKIIKNSKTNRWLPYDIYIPEKNIFIEIQGEQHYVNKPFWYSSEKEFENRKYLDNIKKNFAKENGVFIEVDLRKIKTIENAIFYVENLLRRI